MSMAFENKPFNCDGFMEKEFLRLKNLFNITHVIETGTYKGVTTHWLAQHFPHVFTMEIMENYYKEALANLAGLKNVCAYHGDSRKILPMLLKNIRGNLMIFLDSHWYENPLRPELQIIADSGLKPLICIHDMQNPNDPTMGYDTYPDQKVIYNMELVKPGLDAIYGEDKYQYFYNTQAEGARRGALFTHLKGF